MYVCVCVKQEMINNNNYYHVAQAAKRHLFKICVSSPGCLVRTCNQLSNEKQVFFDWGGRAKFPTFD